jgi:CRP-like cAMP-binding protein
MVSPELLRRYPLFSTLNDKHLKSIAMIAEEFNVQTGTVLVMEGQPAEWFFLLLEGSIELTYKSEEEYHPKTKKVFSIGEINPGEAFGISSLLEPYRYLLSAHAGQDSRVLKLNAVDLRKLMNNDLSVGYALMHQIAKSAMERLNFTQVQLAAAWAEWGK